eukprot:10754383-Prorocentrum_lima.AAC.1
MRTPLGSAVMSLLECWPKISTGISPVYLFISKIRTWPRSCAVRKTVSPSGAQAMDSTLRSQASVSVVIVFLDKS